VRRKSIGLSPEMVRAGPAVKKGLPAEAARGVGGRAGCPYLPHEQHAKLTVSAGVTYVTDDC
jgi:hypothetical protein